MYTGGYVRDMQGRGIGWLSRIGPERALGLLTLGILVFFAWHFHLERTICYDSGYQVWRIINTGAPNAEHHRWSVMLVQLPPLLFLKAGASVASFLKAYSVCLALLPVAVFALVALRWNDMRVSIALPIGMVASTSLAFHFGVSEVYQGLPIPFLFWAVLRRALVTPEGPRAYLWMIAAGVIALWALLYHTVFILPLLFMLVLEVGAQRAWLKRRAWAALAVVIAVTIARSAALGATRYEEARMIGLDDVSEHLLRLHELPSSTYLLSVAHKFTAFHMLVGVCVLCCALARAWWPVVWTVIASTGTLVLILIADRDIGSPYMYENLYPFMGAIWAACFAEAAWRLRERVGGWTVIPAALVLCVGLVQVWQGHFMSTWKVMHLQRMTSTLHTRGIHKAIVSAHVMHGPYDHIHWALPFETMVLSAAAGPSHTVTIFADNQLDTALARMEHPNEILGPPWGMGWYGFDALPVEHFDLRSGSYQLVTALPDTAATDLNRASCSLLLRDTTFVLSPAPFSVIVAELENRDHRPLPALGKGRVNGLYCQLFTQDGLTKLTEQFAPLELDVPADSRVQQAVIIGHPEHTGRYLAKIDLLVDGELSGVHGELTVEKRRFGF